MKIRIVGESNFFLFQDIYLRFVESLEGSYYSHFLKNKHERDVYYSYNAFEYIYNSWLHALFAKLFKAGLKEKGHFLVSKLPDWMITTNIAIITAQKGRGRKDISSYELEYVDKYSSSFAIEHSEDFETYIVYLEGEMENAFLCALNYYNAFKDMNVTTIIEILQSLYEVEEKDIEEEVNVISKHFELDSKYLDTFEILEDKNNDIHNR